LIRALGVNVSDTNETKPWWKSKTIWFNIIVALLAVAEAQSAQLAQMFTPHVYAYISVGVAAVNTALRIVTTAAINSK
jgi:hypothetical protein